MSPSTRHQLHAVTIAAAFLAFALVTGCKGLQELKKLTTKGYMAPDLLPADREVGSWRRGAKVASIGSRGFQDSWGPRMADRLKPWELSKSVSCVYRLGATGRTLTVEIFDLARPAAAFDLYSYARFRALRPSGDGKEGEADPAQKPIARVTKVGAQGLLYDSVMGPGSTGYVRTGKKASGERVLVFWAERFLFKLTERGGNRASAETALVAFGSAITGRVKQPFELAEVYVLQIPGEVPNSERYVPGDLLGRRELPAGVVADWKGKSGRGTLFISVFPKFKKAEYAFEKLRRATGGVLSPTYENGLFAGRLPSGSPITCFRRGTAIIGLVAAVEVKERMAALEQVRKRCVARPGIPAIKPGEGRGK